MITNGEPLLISKLPEYLHALSLYWIFRIWIVSEILFYLYFLYKRSTFQLKVKPQTPLNKQQRTELFWNCVYTIKDLQSWCEGWFYYKSDHSHPSINEIKENNLALWFAWAFWHDHLDIVRQNEEWAAEIDWMIATAETWFHHSFPKGMNTNVECIRLNLDPVEAVHRPLIMYVAIYLITKLFNIIFLQWCWGFKPPQVISTICWGGPLALLDGFISACKNFILTTTIVPKLDPTLSYWYRPGGNETPLVFIHGIGAGVLFYAEFVFRLLALDRPLFLVELPYVAMHMVDKVPNSDETVKSIQEMLARHGYKNAVFVSHSLGTATTSWVMNKEPRLCAGAVLIDPICFLLHYHNVAFNFVHRIPKNFIERIIYYAASRELCISNYISRHFQWFESIYFNKNAPFENNVSVYLSEKDSIVGSSAVHEYLLEKEINHHVMPGLEHATFLLSGKWKSAIFKQIQHTLDKADKSIINQ
ncbi:alpha/beta-hydrolase [Backusella circina FSU 941]|nr:alpha/beta-hydrolase [Backusella circina FSU 941]